MTTLVPEMSLENSVELKVKLNKNHIHVHVTNDWLPQLYHILYMLSCYRLQRWVFFLF